jgi:hypothetical protein
MSAVRFVVLVCLGLGAMNAPAWAQEPFYKGKRLTVLVNFDAGSATDIEGRVFARHFAKHTDGQPQVIVQNIAGAGGNNGTQYLGEVAPKDGTTLGYLTGSAWNFASQPNLFRHDFRDYEFIGFQGGTVVYYVRTDVPPGIKQPADLLKAQGLVSGGIAATTGRDLAIRLVLDILVPFRHVGGYRSSERVRLALQRAKCISRCDDASIAARSSRAGEGRKRSPLFVDPCGMVARLKLEAGRRPAPGLPGVLLRVKGAMPTGVKWRPIFARHPEQDAAPVRPATGARQPRLRRCAPRSSPRQ